MITCKNTALQRKTHFHLLPMIALHLSGDSPAHILRRPGTKKPVQLFRTSAMTPFATAGACPYAVSYSW